MSDTSRTVGMSYTVVDSNMNLVLNFATAGVTVALDTSSTVFYDWTILAT